MAPTHAAPHLRPQLTQRLKLLPALRKHEAARLQVLQDPHH